MMSSAQRASSAIVAEIGKSGHASGRTGRRILWRSMGGPSKIRRLLQLIELLQSGRTYNTRELAELSGISRRQVFRDLKALQDSGIPLLFDAQRQGYWLTGSTYLPPTDFTLDETLSLLI